MIQTCTYLCSSNFTPQVKEASNQSQIFNKKSISRNTTHCQSYGLIQIESFYSNAQTWSQFTLRVFCFLFSTTKSRPGSLLGLLSQLLINRSFFYHKASVLIYIRLCAFDLQTCITPEITVSRITFRLSTGKVLHVCWTLLADRWN